MNRANPAELRGTLVALLAIVFVAVADLQTADHYVFIGLLGLGPLLAALYCRPRQTLLVSVVGIALSLYLGVPMKMWLTPGHISRICTVLGCGVFAVLLSRSRHAAAVALARNAAFIRILEIASLSANNAVSVEAAIQSCMAAVCANSRWIVGHAYLRDERAGGHLISSKIWHPNRLWRSQGGAYVAFCKAAEQLTPSPGHGLAGQVLAEKQAVWLDDLAVSSGYPLQRAALAVGFRAAFALPVLVGDDVVVVLEFFSRENSGPRTDLYDVVNHIGALLSRVFERQQGLAAITESESRFRTVAQAAADAIIISDGSGMIIFWNPSAQAMFGHNSVEATGRELTLILPPRYHEAHREAMARFFAGNEADAFRKVLELEGQHRDGQVFPIEISLSHWRSAGRDYFSSIVRDVRGRAGALVAQQEANARLLRTTGVLRMRNQEISLLSEMAKHLHDCASEAAMNALIIRSAAQLAPRCSGALYLFVNSIEKLDLKAAWGDAAHGQTRLDAADCRAVRLGKSILGEGGMRAARCRHLGDGGADSLCLPLMVDDKPLGLMIFQAGPEAAPGSLAERQALLIHLAEQVAKALRNLHVREQLHSQSVRDPATGFFNRRYLEQYLEQQLGLAAQQGKPLSLVLYDFDHFKHYNDTLGHLAGDALLREVSDYVAGHTRKADVLCRYGGDEFVLIMPGATVEEARDAAELLGRMCQALPMMGGHPDCVVTLSFGVAGFPRDGNTLDQLLAAADAALYRAKHAGRNRVVIAQGSAPRKISS